MTKNKNILEILRERNKELVAEIEKHLTVEELNEENDREDLTPFYEGLIVDLKEIMKRIIEYDDAKIDILYLDRESFNKGSAHELLNRIEERLEEVAFQWDDCEGEFGEKWKRLNELKTKNWRRCPYCPPLNEVGKWKAGINFDQCNNCGFEVDKELKMLKGFRELAFRLILLCSGYKREKMIDQFSFDYQLLEKVKFKEENEKLSKDLDGSQKEIERLNNLVENLEKVPDDFEKAQTSWYKRRFPQYFAELEKNIKGRNIDMTDFISLLVKKIGRREKKLNNLEDSLQDLQKSNNKLNQWLNQEKYQTGQIRAEFQQERINYHNTAINLGKERAKTKKATIARDEIKKKSLKLKNDFDSKQEEASNLQTKIKKAEQDLGTSLGNLATELEGKTLAEYVSRERERERRTWEPVGSHPNWGQKL